MAGFNGLLDATFLPPRNWTLNEKLTYDCDTLSESLKHLYTPSPNPLQLQAPVSHLLHARKERFLARS